MLSHRELQILLSSLEIIDDNTSDLMGQGPGAAILAAVVDLLGEAGYDAMKK